VELGWPGLDPVKPSLDIIALDSSGSVTAPGGTDPIGNRFEEATRAMRVVEKWTVTRGPKVAVVHFDQPSESDSGVVTLAAHDALRQLRRSLRLPSDGYGTSCLKPAFVEAQRLAHEYADHDVRLTVFSDFELLDDDPVALLAELAEFPGHVYAVVLDSEPPDTLAGPNVTVSRLKHGDPPGSLAAIMHRSLTATRRGIGRKPPTTTLDR
jgi:hypothetical protein